LGIRNPFQLHSNIYFIMFSCGAVLVWRSLALKIVIMIDEWPWALQKLCCGGGYLSSSRSIQSETAAGEKG